MTGNPIAKWDLYLCIVILNNLFLYTVYYWDRGGGGVYIYITVTGSPTVRWDLCDSLSALTWDSGDGIEHC